MRSTAKAVLARHWDRRLPVDPVRIAKSLQFTVSSEPPPTTQPAIVGKAALCERVGRIWFDATQCSIRQRFSIAHALGHLVLGHVEPSGSIADSIEKYRLSEPDWVEREANRFAMHLLLPATPLNYSIRAGMTSIADLGKRFGVSQVAVKARLRELGFIS